MKKTRENINEMKLKLGSSKIQIKFTNNVYGWMFTARVTISIRLHATKLQFGFL